MTLPAAADAVDRWLLSASTRVKTVVIALTLVSMAATVVTKVPKPFLDYSRRPLLAGISQPDEFGTDTIADAYEARVVRHDVSRHVHEAARRADAARSGHLDQRCVVAVPAGHAAGAGGAVGRAVMPWASASTAPCRAWRCCSLAPSLVYFLRTRWYLFPLLYLNFAYVGERFFYVQDGSYLVMLTVVMAALFVARRFPNAAHTLMAVAIVTKLSPLYYVRHLGAMPRWTAALVLAILAAGLVAPYFIWDNYLYIFRYNSELKGDTLAAAGALALAVPFAALLMHVETKRGFDLEDLIGWSLVPVALFLAFKMNVARHLLLVLLVPDKRGLRNVAAAAGLALHSLAAVARGPECGAAAGDGRVGCRTPGRPGRTDGHSEDLMSKLEVRSSNGRPVVVASPWGKFDHDET